MIFNILKKEGEIDVITIYTDGSCDLSKRIGGWAAILIDSSGREKVVKGSYENATSNRMELMAVLQSLFLLSKPEKIKIITDSKYVEESVNKGWLERWIKDDEIERPHFELWRMLYNLLEIHDITVEWVKGHSGNEYNEKCDKLAHEEMLLACEPKKNLFDIASNPEVWKSEVKDNTHLFEEEVESIFGEDLEETLNSMRVDKTPIKERSVVSNDSKVENKSTAVNSESVKPKKSSKSKKKSSSAGYYAVAIGREKGIFNTWTECLKSVNKYPGAKFKKFSTRTEAEQFVRNSKK